jgi:N-acetylglucosamine-6-sulfatase
MAVFGVQLLPPGHVAAEGLPSKPNFVVIVSDDQRWDTIGRCLNGFDAFDFQAGANACMPHLQGELIGSGTTFWSGYVTTSLCCPSRSSILTGRYAHHHNVWQNGWASFNDKSTLPTWLDGAGYRTGMFGKYLNGYGNPGTPNGYVPPGWDSWHAYWGGGSPGYYTNYTLLERDPGTSAALHSYANANSTSTAACSEHNFFGPDFLCSEALTFLRADPAAPFFLYLAPPAPHEPSTVAARWKNRFSTVTPPTYDNLNRVPTPNTPSWLPTTPLSDKQLSQLIKKRRAALESNLAVDDEVDALYQELANDGRLDDTVFVYISDNGLAQGEHRYTAKSCEYEECNRVPFVISCPPQICPNALPGNVDTANFALNIDIAPTITQLADVSPGLAPDGTSLLPLLSGGQPTWRTWFIIEDKITSNASGIVSQEPDGHTYKWVELGSGQRELYDLTVDPWELTNLWNDGVHAATQSTLAARLAAALRAPVTTITSGPASRASVPSSNVTFGYAADEVSTFECKMDAGAWTACGFGSAASTTYTGLTLAQHTFQVRATDADNNVGRSVSRTFTVTKDTTPPPVPTITSVPSDPSGPDVSFGFEDAEAGVGFTCALDGASPTACSSPQAYTGLADGAHTFEVRAVDQAGNASASAGFSWTVTSASP